MSWKKLKVVSRFFALSLTHDSIGLPKMLCASILWLMWRWVWMEMLQLTAQLKSAFWCLFCQLCCLWLFPTSSRQTWPNHILNILKRHFNLVIENKLHAYFCEWNVMWQNSTRILRFWCFKINAQTWGLMHISKGMLNLPTSSLHLCSPFQQKLWVKIHHHFTYENKVGWIFSMLIFFP